MKRRKFDNILKSISDLLRTLAHPDRLRLISLLQNEEMDVTHLHEAMQISSSLVSQHLKLLKLYGLVKERREGKHVYYRIHSQRVLNILTSALELHSLELSHDPETIALMEEMMTILHPRKTVS